ncbi:MAG: hypothetical protein KGS61_12480 [Verrucomicrobia bacterium]|nr:hypothetical protein [Verrucomicrobiota bacterium]
MNIRRVLWRGCLALPFLVGAGPVAGATLEPSLANLPRVKVLAPDPTAFQGASSGAFTLIRAGSTNTPLTVSFALGGSAANGVDYALLPTNLTIPAGLWAVNLTVQPIDAGRVEPNKTVVLSLVPQANYRLGSPHAATITIVGNRFNDIPPTVTLLSPTNGAVFAPHADVNLLADAADPDDSIVRVLFLVDDRSVGGVTNPPYSLTWSNAAPGHHTLLALAKDALDQTAVSTPVHIFVTNAPPVVALLSPTNGLLARVPTNLVLTATANDHDDTIQRIAYYANGRFLHAVTNSPYTWTWTNTPPGRYELVVRATDVFGAVGQSAPVRITVSNDPPTVRLLSPTNGASFSAPTNITLRADATDGDDAIHRVIFFSNGRFLHSLTNRPYVWTWTNAPPGVHFLVVRAIDSYGASTASLATWITVNRPLTATAPASPAGSAVTRIPNIIPVAVATNAPPGPMLTAVTDLPDGNVQLTITGPVGGRVAVETSANFADWTLLTVVSNATGTIECTAPSAADAARRFYRVRAAD